jgi:tetratricopeptide (TPR) repeat protein
LLHPGRVALVTGQLAEAQRHFEEALAAAVGADALPDIQLAGILNALGKVALVRQEWDAASRDYRQSLRQAPQCAAWHIQDAQCGLAQVALAQDKPGRACNLLARVAGHHATSAATRAKARRLLPRPLTPAGTPEITMTAPPVGAG